MFRKTDFAPFLLAVTEVRGQPCIEIDLGAGFFVRITRTRNARIRLSLRTPTSAPMGVEFEARFASVVAAAVNLMAARMQEQPEH